MRLLQTLESEHRRIDAVTRALEAFAQRLGEETVLLPALVAAAASTRMPWDAAKVRAIADAAVAFVVFSREHMRKEQSLLFPVAEMDLEPKAAELDVLLRRFEIRRAPRWNVPWLEQLGEELAASHGTATPGSVRSTLPLP